MHQDNRQILLYGLGGPEKAYAVLKWYCIYDQDISIAAIIRESYRMVGINPSIKYVYAIDNRRGLKREYMDAFRIDSVESHYIFKDILEREGMRVL